MPGHIIKRYRELKNFSQKYVAAKMGISQNAYSKIENNITQLTVHHINELSKIFEVPVTDFLKDDFEIHKPITIPHNVSKTDLLEMLKTLQKKVEAKRTIKHESYMVVMSLIIAADSSLNVVH
jgi:transcriptional regulator with XRE-family HTH domain